MHALPQTVDEKSMKLRDFKAIPPPPQKIASHDGQLSPKHLPPFSNRFCHTQAFYLIPHTDSFHSTLPLHYPSNLSELHTFHIQTHNDHTNFKFTGILGRVWYQRTNVVISLKSIALRHTLNCSEKPDCNNKLIISD